eukprot:gene2539-2841_t
MWTLNNVASRATKLATNFIEAAAGEFVPEVRQRSGYCLVYRMRVIREDAVQPASFTAQSAAGK